MKRVFDLFLALAALVLAAPLWAAIAVAIKVGDGGPVFYRQRRWGKGKGVIEVWKFRSMVVDADFRQAVENDPRITRVGRWLRATGLDEMPQILSIIRGEMSWVGPRALPINEIQADGDTTRDEDILGFDERSKVLPGLTGLAQIHVSRDAPRSEKFLCDLIYINKRSIFLDMELILISVWLTVLGRWGEVGQKVSS